MANYKNTMEITPELQRKIKEYEQLSPKEKEKRRKRIKDAIEGGPAKITPERKTVDPKLFDKFSMSKRYGGAVMKARGGTFKGTF